MLRRWIVYSVACLLIGLNIWLWFDNLLSLLLLTVMLVASAVFLIFGCLKTDVFA